MAKVSELIKKEAKIDKLAKKEDPKLRVGNISFDKVKEIAKTKKIPGNTPEAKIRQVVGSCISYRITIDGKDPKEFRHFGMKK
jgi:ribosomal protein L11